MRARGLRAVAVVAACTWGAAIVIGQTSAVVVFTDVTAAAGIRFTHQNGAFGRKYLPETMGSGVAFLDIDNDGAQDIFFVNSTAWPGQSTGRGLPALYRNNGHGSFADITASAGLNVEMYGLGATAADFDNDGLIDLYVTALGQNHLFRNVGARRFADVTRQAGVGDGGFSTSAAWFDYDRDGLLDLFVGHYVQWSAAKDLFCTLDGKSKSYCTPESYPGQAPTLFHNRGNGTFENVTVRAGLNDSSSKALGVALVDYNADGWMDLYVANDTQPNRLYRNNRNGTFTDVATAAGVAFNEAGVARAGMGVDAADYDGSGRPSLIVGNFANEMMALYTNEGNGLFIDEAAPAGIGKPTLRTLTFGAFFFDADLDGRYDIFAANGHVADDIARVQPAVSYAEPPHLFRNLGARRFASVASSAGPDFNRPMVARGAAHADVDGDGDLDVLVSTNNGPARLLRNDRRDRNGAVRVSLIGVTSNRSGIGAKVEAFVDGKPGPWNIVKTGSSYCSQSELPLTFGLGARPRVSALKVTWPNGRVEMTGSIEANQSIVIQEGKGVIRQQALRPPQ